MTQYVLDTSALLTYIENEEGAAEVEALLEKALDAEAVLYISMVSCIEVFYITWQEQGKDVAAERIKLIDCERCSSQNLARKSWRDCAR